MRRIIPTIILAAGVVLGLRPLLGDTLPARVEIPYGTLVSDRSCTGATHVLLDPCAPHPPEVYVVFPPFKNVQRFERRNVILRGIVERSPCGLLILHATEIDVSAELPQCPPRDAEAPPAR